MYISGPSDNLFSSLSSSLQNLHLIYFQTRAEKKQDIYPFIRAVGRSENLGASSNVLRTQVRGDFNIHGTKYF